MGANLTGIESPLLPHSPTRLRLLNPRLKVHSTYCDVHSGFQASSHELRTRAIDVFVSSEVGIDLSIATMYPPSLTCFRTLEHSP